MTTAQKFQHYGEAVLAFRTALPDVVPLALLDLLESIGKAEVRLQRLHLQACNVGLTPAEEAREAKITEALRKELAEHGLGLRVNGDPRGVAVRVLLPTGASNRGGGDGEWGPTWVE
jgi:hypothetical protein